MSVLDGSKCQKSLEDRNLPDTPVDIKDEKRLQYTILKPAAEVISSMAISGFSPVSQKSWILI